MIRFLMTAGAASAFALSAAAQDVAVENANLWTGDDLISGATIVIQDGTVIAAGPDADIPSGMETLDAGGAWVTPGIFSAYSQVGIVEVGAEDSTNDTTAPMSGFSAALDVADAFNPAATTVPATRLEGVTRIAVMPGFGSSLLAGQGLVASTSGEPESITEPKAFAFVNLGETGAGLAGGSRAAAWANFRAALSDARTYPARYIASEEGDILNRVDARALAPAARGDQLLLVAVSRASDIRNVIALKEEYSNLRLALVGAQEGWMVADALAAADIPVIIDPYDNLPARFESLGSTQENAQRLIEAGVTTAIAYFDDSSHQARLILQSAGNAVANGLNREDALAAITSAPAEVFGLERLGHLTPGSTGDLVIWDGDPLEVMSAPTKVFIDGIEQPLESRQTKLRDRYLDLGDTDLPFAYRRED